MQRGFTLIEALIVLVVLAILMAAGLPSFGAFVRNQRVKNASFDIYSTLVQARSEAIARNSTVTVTQSSGNWANGWTVTDSLGTVIRTHESMPNITITNAAASIVYNGSGRLTSTTQVTFEVSALGSEVITRCIKIDPSGRPSSKASTCT